jgi:hypothetical protein
MKRPSGRKDGSLNGRRYSEDLNLDYFEYETSQNTKAKTPTAGSLRR